MGGGLVMRDSSIDAYRQQVASGQFATQKAAVIEAAKRFGPLSRRSLAEITGIEINAICGAVNKAIAENELMDWQTGEDPKTGKRVHLVEKFDRRTHPDYERPEAKQASLF